MSDKDSNDFKTELGSLVGEYTNDTIPDMDIVKIKEIQNILHGVAASLDTDIQDIEHSILGLRTKLLAFMLSQFAENGDVVHDMNWITDKKDSFSIEVDIPWEEETIDDFYEALEKMEDPVLEKAWHMYHVSIHQGHSTIYFKLKPSS